jgi:2-phosphoglycerate kinase
MEVIPLVYIVTGVAKSGKSLVSKTIQKQYQLSCISTDEIMMAQHKTNPTLELDIYASDSTVARIIEPFIKQVIIDAISQDTSLLIEGVHFNTDFAYTLLQEYPNSVRIVYLGYESVTVEQKVQELYTHQNEIDNPWIFHHRGERVEDIVQYLREESARIHRECETYNLPYIDVYDITTQIPEITALLFDN